MLIKNREDFVKLLPEEGRILGIDVGDTTLGLAVSDVRRSIASPLLTIERKKFSKDIEKLKQILEEQKICALIIGKPINMDGSHGTRVQITLSFISNLGKHTSLPVFLWDERFSSMAVEKMMLEADLSRKRRAELVDKLAASYMLQGYLDSTANRHS